MEQKKESPLWSATPTPFTDQLKIDVQAVVAMIEHQVNWRLDGVMVCGTCGEGPWLADADREVLIRTAVDTAQGCLPVAVQITDNSARRMLEQAERAAKWGATHVVVAQPYFLVHATPRSVAAITMEVIRNAPLPVVLYDRGRHSSHQLDKEDAILLAAEDNVIAIKESSRDVERMRAYATVAAQRGNLLLLSGDEFACDQAMAEGASGLFLGGAIVNARLAREIIRSHRAGDAAGAAAGQARMSDFLWRVYGGRNLTCWLAGLKYLLVRLGIFSGWNNLPGYPLTEECRDSIDRLLDARDPDNFCNDLK